MDRGWRRSRCDRPRGIWTGPIPGLITATIHSFPVAPQTTCVQPSAQNPIAIDGLSAVAVSVDDDGPYAWNVPARPVQAGWPLTGVSCITRRSSADGFNDAVRFSCGQPGPSIDTLTGFWLGGPISTSAPAVDARFRYAGYFADLLDRYPLGGELFDFIHLFK